MYWIQFRLQFFYWYSLFIQEIVIIKATRLQAWAPARGGGKSKPSPPPPSASIKKKKFFGYIGGLFATFSHFGGFFTMWGPFYYFLLHGGGLFWGLRPLRKFLRAPMIARVREHALRNFFV